MERKLNPSLKLALDLGPLLVFFGVNAWLGIFWATGTFMAAMVASLAVTYALSRAIAPMPVITLAFVMVFGGLTLWLRDETFIKIKPTLVYLLFSAILGGGMVFGRPLLKPLLGTMLALSATGWRRLTWRWAGFFLILAVLNEILWRNVSTDTWVAFKVFGFLPLTLVFALAQVPLIQRHEQRGKDIQSID
jgi:intracellular septation protein